MFYGYTKSFSNDELEKPLYSKISTNMAAKPDQQALYTTQRVKHNIKFIKYDRDFNPASIPDPETKHHLHPPLDQKVNLPSSSIHFSQAEGRPMNMNSKLSIVKRKSHSNNHLSSFIPNNPAVSLAQN